LSTTILGKKYICVGTVAGPGQERAARVPTCCDFISENVGTLAGPVGIGYGSYTNVGTIKLAR